VSQVYAAGSWLQSETGVDLPPLGQSGQQAVDPMYLLGRAGEGALHAFKSMVTEPGLQTRDLSLAALSVGYNELVTPFTGGEKWFHEMISGTAQVYENGASQTRLLLRSNFVTGASVASYDMTTAAMNGQWGKVAEQAGGLAVGFVAGKAIGAYGDRALQMPLTLDLQPGTAMYSGIPIKPRSIFANKAAGDAWETEVINNVLPATQEKLQPQITIKSNGPSGLNVRLDALGKDLSTGSTKLSDMKASQTAPFTPNQTIVYPELGVYGGVVVGKGKPPYIGGTQIPPSVVDIIRKPK
jgi:hypothetical protein